MGQLALRKNKLGNILDLKQLKKLFKYFSMVTNLDVACYDYAGREIIANRKKNSVCGSAKNGTKCREYINAGSLRASELGEPYICACGCGLIMCFSPIMYEERLIGSITCGPAVLWDADEVAKKEFIEKTGDMNIHVDINALFNSIASCSCTNMTGAAQILFIIVNSLTKEHSTYLNQRAKITEQQSQIAELISLNKKEKSCSKPAYPAEREIELISCMRNGNVEQAKKVMNILLGEIFSFADGNPDTIKVRLLELITFFSRSSMECGAPIPDINAIATNAFTVIGGEQDFEQLCFQASRIMEEFTGMIRRNSNANNVGEYLSKAIKYMAANYMYDLTLKKVSDSVYISAFYLSHLFRKEMNTTFSDHLCKIRIDKAKDLLKRDFRIQETAEKTGFNDSNYFAKSFKKITGVTPREYKSFFR